MGSLALGQERNSLPKQIVGEGQEEEGADSGEVAAELNTPLEAAADPVLSGTDLPVVSGVYTMPFAKRLGVDRSATGVHLKRAATPDLVIQSVPGFGPLERIAAAAASDSGELATAGPSSAAQKWRHC